jgi:hypothetical protein
MDFPQLSVQTEVVASTHHAEEVAFIEIPAAGLLRGILKEENIWQAKCVLDIVDASGFAPGVVH